MLLNRPTVPRNRKGRAGDYCALGVSDGGHPVVVVIAWDPARRLVRPITAWEQQ